MKTKMKTLLLSLLCFAMIIGMIPTIAYAATTIDNVDMLIYHPVHLQTPDTFLQIYGGTCQIDTYYNSDGYQNGLRWRKVSTGTTMSAADTFVGGELYELSVCLFAKSGYAFAASRTEATINLESASLTVQDVNHARATIQLIADNMYINSVNITGLDAPQSGCTPDYFVTVQENTCKLNNNVIGSFYNNGIAWVDHTNQDYILPGIKYQEGHKYGAEINLIANQGYEFPNSVQICVDGNWITVNNNMNKDMLTFTYLFPAIEVHTHTPSAWRTTQVYHYKVCTTCGDMLDQEDHMGGNATCADPGLCTACGYAYQQPHENHTPDTSKWIARADMYHYHKCKICGAHCDIDDHRWSPKYHAVDATGHAYQCADCKGYDKIQPHNPGPAATETTPQTCKDCGYIIAPIKNHVHDFSKVPYVPATCTQEGNIEYYVCVLCMNCYTDSQGKDKIPSTMSVMIDALGHTASAECKYDENNHWRICTVCKEVMTNTKTPHTINNGKCTICDYKETLEEDTTLPPSETTPITTESQSQQQVEAPTIQENTTLPPSETTPVTTEPQSQQQVETPAIQENTSGIPWWAILLIGLGGIGAGIGIAFIFIKLNKKS